MSTSACSISIRRRLVGYLLFVANHHDGELLFHHIFFRHLLYLLWRYGVHLPTVTCDMAMLRQLHQNAKCGEVPATVLSRTPRPDGCFLPQWPSRRGCRS